MIRVLIVDDDAKKTVQIERVITDILGESRVTIHVALSYVSAGLQLEKHQYDLLILDIRLPRDDNDQPEPYLGKALLQLIVGGGRRLLRPKYVVGLTAYRELDNECNSYFAREGWCLLYFDPATEDWEIRLSRILVHVGEVAHVPSDTRHDIDLAIVTAHAHVELQEILRLPAEWTEQHYDGDSTLYHLGTFNRDDAKLKVVSCCAVQMGMPAATALSMKVIERFRPRCLAMAGIAAGVKGRYGDILIADQSWDYGSGKSVRHGDEVKFLPAPEAILIPDYLRCRLAQFRLERDVLRSIRERWSDSAPEELSADIGPIASGAAVLENRWQIEQIINAQRKLIGVEMETYGVFTAARLCTEPRPLYMSIKSICDYGEEGEKSDDYQQYAAFTSAQFTFEFSLTYLVP